MDDGNIEFLGRIDHQVKLRGFRIELSEIEVILRRHDSVQEAAVTLHKKDDNPRLIAYVVLKSSDDVEKTEGGKVGRWEGRENVSLAADIEALRGWVRERLPEYMVPSGFVRLDRLPLTPNGKIDRKSLPEPDASVRSQAETPRTGAQELLCNLWSQVLGVSVQDIDADFFEAGGHSLIATQLVSRIRESFDVEMPLPVVFERPLLRDQAEWLENRQRGGQLPPIERLKESQSPALSFAQQRLWFLARLEGSSATYNIPVALKLEGELHEEALKKSLAALIQRHHSLRLAFPMEGGEPVVRLNRVYDPLTVTDLSNLPESERQARVSELTVLHAGMAFDLEAGPLFSVHLLRLGDGEHMLLFNMHHIISDGWSMGILVREWGRLYTDFAQDREPQLEALTLQYTDYAAWKRSWLQGETLERQLSYWTGKLSGAPDLLQLPLDFPRPAVMTFTGRHLQFSVGSGLAQKVGRFALDCGATPFMILLAVFNLLLSRYCRQEEIVTGSPIAGRNHRQTESLIGFFVNTLVLRNEVDGEGSFNRFLKRVRQTALEAYSHQDIPFEYLVERLNPSRSLSHTPLFQVMFVYRNTPGESIQLPGLTLSFPETDIRTAKFDLTLTVMEQGDLRSGGDLICDWEFNTRLFKESTINRMANHFKVLLESVLEEPQLPVSAHDLLTSEDRNQLLDWNQTETPFQLEIENHADTVSGQLTIVDLFHAQVDKNPDRAAAVFEDGVITYRELNVRAGELAKVLASRGAGPETLVGVCLERSPEMVIAIWGILKAGAAYVPLDPGYPVSRLRFMLQDSRASLLLTQRHVHERLPGLLENIQGVDSLYLDDGLRTVSGVSDDISVTPVLPEHAAYAIYTSGSTGLPKGVMVDHGNLFHSTLARWNYYSSATSARELDRFLLLSPVAFDSSVAGFFWALVQGAALVLTDPSIDISGLTKFAGERCITHTICVPSMYSVMLSKPEPAFSASVRAVIIAGESGSVELLSRHYELLPDTRLFNEYGPTEGTVWATVHAFQSDDKRFRCIGRPIANTQIHIRDARHHDTPPGIPGELWISGDGIARGYLNRPELTRRSFVKANDSEDSVSYRTGDLARWLDEGSLEFLGRIDHQIKLRGFRIELPEIEAQLIRHERVKEAVVVLSGPDSNRRLAAYVMLNKDFNAADGVAAEIKDSLKKRLPDYMVPAHIAPLETFPLTPNGKIDRKALSRLPVKTLSSQKEYILPSTFNEKRLAAIWAELLGVEQIGIYDNFFDSGGHSLLLVKLQARITETFNYDIPMVDLFGHPTIHSLSLHLTDVTTGKESEPQPETVNRAEERKSKQSSAKERRQARKKHRAGK